MRLAVCRPTMRSVTVRVGGRAHRAVSRRWVSPRSCTQSVARASRSATGYGMGLGPQAIATISLAMVTAGFAGSTLTPRLARRLGDRAVLASGGGLISLGFLGMALFHDTLAQCVACALVVGLATGLFESITRTMSAEVVEEPETALAVGLNELALSLGAAIGAAVIGAFFAAHAVRGTTHISESGYLWGWGACACAALVGMALALRYRGPREAHATYGQQPARSGELA